MASLYEIRQELLACINEETGEIDEERFMALQLERDVKLGNIARWIIDLKAEQEKFKAEIVRLGEFIEKAAKQEERLKRALADELNGENWTDGFNKISFRRNAPKAQFDNKEEFLTWALDAAPELVKFGNPTLDVSALKDRIKSGEEFPGVRLVQGTSMTIK